MGARYDWSERARAPEIRDRGFSAVLTYWPSEFSQVRGQYRRAVFGDERPAELRALTPEKALAAMETILSMATPWRLPSHRRTHSGLVEQQALFHRRGR